jgi:NADPH:quinone reductase-like Zn-dependent oxidoreductase
MTYKANCQTWARKCARFVGEEFGGYQNLKLAEIPKPAVLDGRVLVRTTAGGVTPLDHTILSGSFPRAKAPLVLGNEGAGVVEGSGDDQFPDGSRVMFTGPYGVFESGAFSEWVAVKKEDLHCRSNRSSRREEDGLLRVSGGTLWSAER